MLILSKISLADSQKLMVFLGGMNIVGPSLEEIETKLEGEKDPLKATEIAEERVKELRVQIVEMLNKSGEVKNILDMFKKTPPFTDFNPIVFVMHLPISLQKHAESLRMEDQAKVEDFFTVYDGKVVMIAATCSLNERIWGAYDIRDKLVAMMKSIVPKLETTPPCLTGEAIVFVNRPKAFSKDSSDIYLPIGREKSIDDVFQHLYLRLHPEIEFFYEACELRKEATELAWKIDERETKLLLCLKEFLATTWWHPLKRKKLWTR